MSNRNAKSNTYCEICDTSFNRREHSRAEELRLDSETTRLLSDYEIHRSIASPGNDPDEDSSLVTVAGGVRRERQPDDFDPTLASHPPVPYPVSTPDWWDRSYRRVPDFRPINRELDLSDRQQGAVFAFVGAIMVGGCWFQSGWSYVWRNTAGRITDIGKSRVGGEW
ncbi:hypothetical protein K456DRAFT_1841083 [Colletotrichum gloeosporioides 23]|nr:hypothetical protein K456DRAFT_1841083 [Colletotrichum gloeosporioides 23]